VLLLLARAARKEVGAEEKDVRLKRGKKEDVEVAPCAIVQP
jgi:hypothetical protein